MTGQNIRHVLHTHTALEHGLHQVTGSRSDHHDRRQRNSPIPGRTHDRQGDSANNRRADEGTGQALPAFLRGNLRRHRVLTPIHTGNKAERVIADGHQQNHEDAALAVVRLEVDHGDTQHQRHPQQSQGATAQRLTQ